MTSSRVIPIPLSAMVIVPFFESKSIWTFGSESLSCNSGFERDSKRNLSAASEALEINSLRNISLLLYREWIIR